MLDLRRVTRSIHPQNESPLPPLLLRLRARHAGDPSPQRAHALLLHKDAMPVVLLLCDFEGASVTACHAGPEVGLRRRSARDIR